MARLTADTAQTLFALGAHLVLVYVQVSDEYRC